MSRKYPFTKCKGLDLGGFTCYFVNNSKFISRKSLEAKKRYSPYEVAKAAGEAKNWKEIKRTERRPRHIQLIGVIWIWSTQP
jgi:hypothetical protein